MWMEQQELRSEVTIIQYAGNIAVQLENIYHCYDTVMMCYSPIGLWNVIQLYVLPIIINKT